VIRDEVVEELPELIARHHERSEVTSVVPFAPPPKPTRQEKAG
jgi:hypothetical protein